MESAPAEWPVAHEMSPCKKRCADKSRDVSASKSGSPRKDERSTSSSGVPSTPAARKMASSLAVRGRTPSGAKRSPRKSIVTRGTRWKSQREKAVKISSRCRSSLVRRRDDSGSSWRRKPPRSCCDCSSSSPSTGWTGQDRSSTYSPLQTTLRPVTCPPMRKGRQYSVSTSRITKSLHSKPSTAMLSMPSPRYGRTTGSSTLLARLACQPLTPAASSPASAAPFGMPPERVWRGISSDALRIPASSSPLRNACPCDCAYVSSVGCSVQVVSRAACIRPTQGGCGGGGGGDGGAGGWGGAGGAGGG
mmetsp:Transcript_25618/g.83764  ORF Transcript_25618/g.83764 Transcript_25618/m.83764 type:complete len:305 (+) Transcript_25618:1546-2460(+)